MGLDRKQRLEDTRGVPEYCSCGTQLVDGARFCHRCGAPQGELIAAEEPVEEATPAVIPAPAPPALPQAALSEISFHNKAAVAVAMLVALLFWLVMFLPLPTIIRAPVLFIDLLAGGFFTVWFYAKRTGQTLTVRKGAHLGWLTGIFCFVIGAVVAAMNMLALALTPDMNFLELFKKALLESGQQPSEVEIQMKAIQDPSSVLLMVLFSMAISFALFVLLPVLGGMLGAKVLEE